MEKCPETNIKCREVKSHPADTCCLKFLDTILVLRNVTSNGLMPVAPLWRPRKSSSCGAGFKRIVRHIEGYGCCNRCSEVRRCMSSDNLNKRTASKEKLCQCVPQDTCLNDESLCKLSFANSCRAIEQDKRWTLDRREHYLPFKRSWLKSVLGSKHLWGQLWKVKSNQFRLSLKLKW